MYILLPRALNHCSLVIPFVRILRRYHFLFRQWLDTNPSPEPMLSHFQLALKNTSQWIFIWNSNIYMYIQENPHYGMFTGIKMISQSKWIWIIINHHAMLSRECMLTQSSFLSFHCSMVTVNFSANCGCFLRSSASKWQDANSGTIPTNDWIQSGCSEPACRTWS